MSKNISCDTSVLINFLKINRMDLFEKYPHSFFITDHVEDEITACYPDQNQRLKAALDHKILHKTNVETNDEFTTFAELSKTRQLGAGECAAIAVAVHRTYHLAIDDNQAIKKATPLLPPDSIIRTQDFIVLLIYEGLLQIQEADQLLQIWTENHRFKLKIASFRELIV